MFCNFHNRKSARSYCRFSNFSQYQLTTWWCHGLDMFSAVVAFREGTFHGINNADWINNADLLWLFVRLEKLLNKQSRVKLLVIWDVMTLTYRQCNDRGSGIIVDTLNLEDRAPVDFVEGYAIFKPNELYNISWLTPQFHFILVHKGLFSIRLDRVYQLARRIVKYERYSQYHYSGTRWASGRLKSMAIQLLAQ